MAGALRDGLISAGGENGRRCEEMLGREIAAPVLLTTSCTHALEMAAVLLNIVPGDEVIVPSFAFVSTANAFALHGASLVFCDCDDYGNLDLDHLEQLISERTRAVVPVHYGGNCCEMDRLVEICEAHKAALVEDAAQCIGAAWRGRPLGAFGQLGCLSFHETKNVTAGEGGALIVGEGALLERAWHVRDKGTNRREFSLGQAGKYTWVDRGSSWGLSDLNAACLLPQLEQFETIAARRDALWKRYEQALAGPATRVGARVLEIPPGCEPNHHLFAVIWRDRAQRDAFIAWMAARGILTPFHYVALHDSPYGRQFGQADADLPGTRVFSEQLVRLPLFYNLCDEDQQQVIDAAGDFMAREA